MGPAGNGRPKASKGAEDYLKALPKQTVAGASVQPVGRSPWRTVFVIAIVVLVLSLVALAAIGLSYFQGQKKYESTTRFMDATSEAAVENPLESSIDWEGLRAINPDIVAWITIPGTPVNYPVVRGRDNDYYLSHDFYGDQGWLANFGTVFMDCRNVPNWSDDAYFFYGHHMNDGSMFAAIAAMGDQARFDEERTVYLYSPSGNFKLRSFSLIHCSADDSLVQVMFPTSEAMAAYVQDKIDRSIVDVGTIPAADEIDKVFAFSTCDNYSVGRYVLFAYVEDTTVFNLEHSHRSPSVTGDAQSKVSDKPAEGVQENSDANSQNSGDSE